MKKEITIDNQKFWYEIDSPYIITASRKQYTHTTYFYDEPDRDIKVIDKFMGFEKIHIEEIRPKPVFSVPISVEDLSLTKTDVRQYVLKAYNNYKAEKQRKIEIENGEII